MTGDGYALRPFGSGDTSVGMVAGSTIWLGAQGGQISTWAAYNAVGNVGWDALPNPPVGPQVVPSPQPISDVFAYNRWMGNNGAWIPGSLAQINNYLLVNNLCEHFHGANPCIQFSADGSIAPYANALIEYNTAVGGRFNLQYNEGAPVSASAGTGGSLSAGTYYYLVTYTEPTGSTACATTTTECAADYAGATPYYSISVAATGTLTFTIPFVNGRQAYIYCDTTAPPTHLCQVTNGADVTTPLATPATYIMKGLGTTARTLPTTLPGLNQAKLQTMQRFNVWMNYNNKSDYYPFGVASGARIGAWERRYSVGAIGNIAVTGSVIGPGCVASTTLFGGPACGMGDYFGLLGYNGTQSGTPVLTALPYRADYSQGNSTFTTPTYPALNVGDGDYHPTSGACAVVGHRVPAGYAAWPTDLDGASRLNDGTGLSGAFEGVCP